MDRAILCAPASRTPPSVIDVVSDGPIERGAVHTRLPTRDDTIDATEHGEHDLGHRFVRIVVPRQ
jgi:hypothetical protein